ncbi:WD repeat-containing protein 81-like [Watersipora subatra]|uniref:WD repeat-containing protein 81-like n=1 Tax=Watersipora subatra TaxID=2589382 RepID=UPI00355AD085
MNIPTVCAIEDKGGTIDVVFKAPKYSLHDALTYSPAVFRDSLAKLEFVIYQMLQCQHFLHSNGTIMGTITLKDIYLDDNLWISMCPKFSSDFLSSSEDDRSLSHNSPSQTQVNNEADESSEGKLLENMNNIIRGSLSELTEKWVHGDISNFDYLMHINKCSGRMSGHPNHHPVFPWIMDFSQPLGGWRDLTQSKFRLNKGDAQLDQTFEVAQQVLQEQQDEEKEDSPAVFPHHISDVLSDITYYTYKARKTPKETLCQFVRQKWVPHEYPLSVQRLQEWTPDECIPEFFTDPSIFRSIHADLPDLEVPSWAESPEDFIEKHRNALESDYVSQSLHHWIDLTFGYKLSGKAAVDAKNVCLELVDGHTTFTDHGVVQLFSKAHPERVCASSKYISCKAPDILYKQLPPRQPMTTRNADNPESLLDSSEFDNLVKSMETLSSEPIHLPPDFDPTQLIERIEKDPQTRTLSKTCTCRDCPFHNDTLYLGCLLAKMILPMQTRLIPDHTSMSLDGYLSCIRQLVLKHEQIIPRALYEILRTALEIDDSFETNLTCNYQLPPVIPDLLLAPSVLPFPFYFQHMYELISYHRLTSFLSDKDEFTSALCYIQKENEREEVELRLKERINLHTQFLSEFGTRLQWEGMELYLPYVTELLAMQEGDHCMQAAWYIFGQLSQILGKSLTRKYVSSLILDLFNKDVSNVRKVKLFHKAFIQQLIMQLGVSHFAEEYTLPLASALCASSLAAVEADLEQHGQRKSVSLVDGLDLPSVLVDCVIWLAARLGPLLTAKYLTSRILLTMKESYSTPLAFAESSGRTGLTSDLISKTVYGDVMLMPAIQCLEEISFLYGEQFILLQYIPAIKRVISSCETHELQESSPASLLSCCTLLLHLIPCITDSTLLDLLEIRVIGEILLPLITIVSSPFHCFPLINSSYDGTSCRRLLAFRILDLIILVSQRIGYDQTRRFLRRTLLAFFRSFDIVHSETGTWCRYKEGKSGLDTGPSSEYMDIKQSAINTNEYYIGTPVSIYSQSPQETSNSQGLSESDISRSSVALEVMAELEKVFTPELAHRAYVQCCQLAGGFYIQKLANDDLIRRLCTEHELQMEKHYKRLSNTDFDVGELPGGTADDKQKNEEKRKSTNWFVPVPVGQTESDTQVSGSPYDSVSGNKLVYIPPVAEEARPVADSATLLTDSSSKYRAISADKLMRSEMETDTLRHLKGDWIAYWEHELGHGHHSNRPFNFKQIALQSFIGHVGAVKSLHALENENSFISGGKDKTVRLWSLRNTGAGDTRCTSQFTYVEHKRPVFSAAYLDSVKLIASCDGAIHVWDPVTGALLNQYEPSKTPGGVTAVQTIENPFLDHYIVAATSESTIRFIDVRSDKLAHEFRLNCASATTLGYISAIAVGSTWVAVTHSIGVLSILDIRTGFNLVCCPCRGVEGDLNQIVSYGAKELVTCSTDGQFALWRCDSSTPLCQSKLTNELQICSMSKFANSIVSASQANRISVHTPYLQEARVQSDVGDKLRADIFKGTLTSMDILPMNRQLILGTDNGSIHLTA